MICVGQATGGPSHLPISVNPKTNLASWMIPWAEAPLRHHGPRHAPLMSRSMSPQTNFRGKLLPLRSVSRPALSHPKSGRSYNRSPRADSFQLLPRAQLLKRELLLRYRRARQRISIITNPAVQAVVAKDFHQISSSKSKLLRHLLSLLIKGTEEIKLRRDAEKG